MAACADAHRRMLDFVRAHAFEDAAQEIFFFRTMRPHTGGLLQYYNSLLRIELGRPVGSFDVLCSYYKNELDTITRFYEDNRFLVTYYRSGETFLDDKLFVRVDGSAGFFPDHAAHEEGHRSLCDGFVTALLANERLAAWLTEAMTASEDKPVSQGDSIKWTDSKAALVELLYALHRRGSFNGGQASVKDIARMLENVFRVDLGNYYRAFQEIRIRKMGRTSYLDSLKTGLIQYMDETDLNYKG
ncbi:hypothetical protein FRZ67_19040 [Panacibacter ginsenosidivorans]|uniref:Tetracycline regulation of excision, RteC n=1 Tax=Panacibacter ginsenosidivorans TaxID=1813871 RepID=A0A5B8VDF0_9BACT|nr:RteC domain-containing protein [Panacibacter ginsenosidivorans]QEC69299.1 hypothetical protein FRZ67_19040 [Panacibacter ginsenosidivorans]